MLPIACALLSSFSISIQETEMLALDRKKIDLSTIVVSPDLNRVGYLSADQRTVFVDKQRIGPFLEIDPVVFSADSKTFGFIARRERELGKELYLDGKYQQSLDPIVRVVRYGTLGNLAWFTSTKEGLVFTHAGGRSAPMPKVLRTTFAIDGSGFAFLYSNPPKELDKKNPDFLIYNSEPAIPRAGVAKMFLAPRAKGILTTSVENHPSSVITWNSQTFRVPGEPKGDPLFSDSGDTFAIRTEFNGLNDDGVEARSAYLVNGRLLQDLNLQAQLQFQPGTEKFALAGKRGDEYFIKRGFELAKPYREVSGFEDAPAEPIRAIRWVGNNLLALFQSKKRAPMLFLEGVGAISVPGEQVFPESLTVSPDKRHIAFFAEKKGLAVCMVASLGAPGPAQVIGKEDFGVSGAAQSAPLWLSNNTIRFHGIRKLKLIKFEATISE